MNEGGGSKSSIGVIGAGIQGICISLCLIKKGFKVTLIDHDDPGKDCASYGNAGHFHLMRPYQLIDQMCWPTYLQCY